MRIRNIARVATIGAAAVTLGAMPAASQVVTFSTSGSFSGTCAGGGGTTCGFAGFTLTYSSLAAEPWNAPTDVDLGSFSVICTACAPGSSAVLSGSSFMLTITQNGPTPGSASFSGNLSGTLGWNPSSSSLFWQPNQNSITIGGTTYGLIETDLGGGNFAINVAAPNIASDPAATTVKADVTTTTPEPATLALVASGLFVIVPLARRRRKQ